LTGYDLAGTAGRRVAIPDRAFHILSVRLAAPGVPTQFDASFGRIKDQGLRYWADPGRTKPDVINTRDGGRGLYFEDPDGHLMEIITRPYGS